MVRSFSRNPPLVGGFPNLADLPRFHLAGQAEKVYFLRGSVLNARDLERACHGVSGSMAKDLWMMRFTKPNHQKKCDTIVIYSL